MRAHISVIGKIMVDTFSKINGVNNIEILRKIYQGSKPSVEIHAEPDGNLLPWESKFGGKPYFTKGMQYPHSNDGRPLSFLAQINFSDLKKYHWASRHMTFFPEEGILQFYIIDNGTTEAELNNIVQFVEDSYNNPSDEMLFGPNSKNPIEQNLFKVIYIPEFHKDAPLQEGPCVEMSTDFPIREEYRLFFTPDHIAITPGISEYYEHFKDIISDNDIEDSFDNVYTGLFCNNISDHRIGGYPYFVQGDPRHQYNYHKDKNIVLLQIGSVGSIHWTGTGIANFLISEEKLKKLDFSEVMYNMDFS